MKKSKETLKKYFETGDKPTQEQFADLIDSYVDTKQPEGEANRRFVIDAKGEVSLASQERSPEYTLSEITGNKLSLLKDGEVVKEIDLSIYLDDTNLSRLVSGTVDKKGMATFKRDDDSTFEVDFSSLLGGAKNSLSVYTQSANFQITPQTKDYSVLLKPFFKSGINFNGNKVTLTIMLTVGAGKSPRNPSEKINFYLARNSKDLGNIGSFELKNHKTRTGVYLLDFSFFIVNNNIYNDINEYVIEDGKKTKVSSYTNSINEIQSEDVTGDIRIKMTNISNPIAITATLVGFKKNV